MAVVGRAMGLHSEPVRSILANYQRFELCQAESRPRAIDSSNPNQRTKPGRKLNTVKPRNTQMMRVNTTMATKLRNTNESGRIRIGSD